MGRWEGSTHGEVGGMPTFPRPDTHTHTCAYTLTMHAHMCAHTIPMCAHTVHAHIPVHARALTHAHGCVQGTSREVTLPQG